MIRDFCSPAITRAYTSCPIESVPNQCWGLGGCISAYGSWELKVWALGMLPSSASSTIRTSSPAPAQNCGRWTSRARIWRPRETGLPRGRSDAGSVTIATSVSSLGSVVTSYTLTRGSSAAYRNSASIDENSTKIAAKATEPTEPLTSAWETESIAY